MANPKPAIVPDGKSVVSQAQIEQAIRQRYSPFPEMTMAILAMQLNQFRTGDLRPAARTWEIMFEREGELSGPALQRYADAARLPWEIEQSEDSAEAENHAASLKYFYDHLTATNILEQDEAGGANLLFRQMMTAKAMRYSVHEILLRIDSAGKREVTAQFNHTPVYFFESRRGRLAYLQNLGDYDGIPLQNGFWLPAVGEGLMRPCSVAYGIKHFALRDNLLFCSRFGVPGIHGEFAGDKESPAGKEFEEALRRFANDWVTATFGGVGQAKINLIEAAKGGSGTLPFGELMDRCDRLYARLFRGGDLSTKSREGTDVVGASLQGDETDIMRADDGQWLTDTLNARVDEPIIAYLYNTTPKAWIRVRPPKPVDSNKEINNLKAAREMNIPVSISTARERLQLPAPADGEEVIGAAPASNDLPDNDMALENSDDAKQKLSDAIAKDLQPLLAAFDARLENILQITDANMRRLKFNEVWSALMDTVGKDILIHPETAQVLEQINARAFAAGMENKPVAIENFAQGQPRDNLGMWVDENGGGLSVKENLKRGQRALERSIRQKADVQKAMHRKEVGQIDFHYGSTGNKSDDYSGGHGISHIVAKHGEKTALQLPEVLAKGKITAHENENRRYVTHKGQMAVLERKNSKSAFVITSFEPKK